MLLPTSQRPAGTATQQQQAAESTSVNGVTNIMHQQHLGQSFDCSKQQELQTVPALRLLAHSWVLRSAVFATQQEQPCQMHDHNAGWAV